MKPDEIKPRECVRFGWLFALWLVLGMASMFPLVYMFRDMMQ